MNSNRNDKKIITKIELTTNEKLTIFKDIRKLPPFDKIGNGIYSNSIIGDPMDLLYEVSNFTSSERFCFFIIKNKIYYDNKSKKIIYIVKNATKGLSKSEIVKFSKGYKKLKEKNIVRKISKGTYMINPNGLIPSSEQYSEAISLWLSLKDTGSD
jgi:hypothetical protein